MTLARTPYARLSPADIGQVDRELKKLEQMSQGLYVPRVLVAARSPYAVQGTDTMLLCDCTAGAITLTFPLAARVDGMLVQVVKSDTSANAVTLSGTFSGVVNPTIAVQDSGFTVVAMNGSYHVTAFVPSPIVPGETGVASILYDYGDPRRYGATGVAGTDARAAFAATDVAAVAGYGANGEVSPHGGTHRLASNLTLASPYRPRPKAIVKPDSAVTLTLNGAMTAGPYQIFDLSAGGKVLARKAAAQRIYAEWFGADPTGAVDSTAALNAMLATAIGSNVVLGSVITCVLSGQYKITDSLHGFSWTAGAFSFCTFHVEGAPSYIGSRAVEIVPNFLDRPCLILQAVRNATVKGVLFTGSATRSISGNDIVLDSGSNPWWNAGLLARDSRYSPYCAIVIDPFSNGVPSDGGIPGHSAFYTQNIGSSVATVEGCTARSFIVAWGIGLSNGSLQCDSIKFRDCVSETCKVHYAVGHDQTRGVRIENAHILYGQMFIDCRRYGAGLGSLPVVTGGVIAGGLKWLINADASRAVATISGLYAESVFSLGFWRSSGGFPLTFTSCTLNMNNFGSGTPECDAHAFFDGSVNFVGGFWGHFNNVYRPLSIAGSGRVVFDGVSITGVPISNNMNLFKFRSTRLRYSTLGGAYGLDDRQVSPNILGLIPNAQMFLPPGGEVVDATDDTDYRLWRYTATNQDTALDVVAITITANGDGTGSFTSAHVERYVVGEWVITTTAWNGLNPDPTDPLTSYAGSLIGVVSAINAGTGLVNLTNMPQSLATGSYTVLLRRLPMFKPRTVGTATSGSNTVPDFSPTSMWNIGDLVNSDRFPTSTYITNIVGSSVTFSQNASASGTAKFYDSELRLERSDALSVPTTLSWFKGDFVRSRTPTKDVNNLVVLGWQCTVTGRADGVAPVATFETMFAKTTSP